MRGAAGGDGEHGGPTTVRVWALAEDMPVVEEQSADDALERALSFLAQRASLPEVG
ncbi:MAG: hypothetical protein R3F14_24930 [Polyangiaceae bacterium]